MGKGVEEAGEEKGVGKRRRGRVYLNAGTDPQKPASWAASVPIRLAGPFGRAIRREYGLVKPYLRQKLDSVTKNSTQGENGLVFCADSCALVRGRRAGDQETQWGMVRGRAATRNWAWRPSESVSSRRRQRLELS